MYSLVFDRGSLGPSTVTLIAFDKVAICGGDVCNMIVRVKLFPETEMSIETLGDEKELSPGGKTRDEFFPMGCYSVSCFGSVARSKTIKTQLIPHSLVCLDSIIHIQFANHEKKYSQYAQLRSLSRFTLHCSTKYSLSFACQSERNIFYKRLRNVTLCINRIDIPNDCSYRD